MLYENLFMCLQLKWYQDLNRILKIELKMPEYIFLYDIDTFSNIRFYIVQNNKIFIKERSSKRNSVNVLNHLISIIISN